MAAAIEARASVTVSREELCFTTNFKRSPHGRFGIKTEPNETIHQHALRLRNDDLDTFGCLFEAPESDSDELSYKVQLSDGGSRTLTQQNLSHVTLASLISDPTVTAPLTIDIVVQKKRPQVRRRNAFGI
jgi:hypothetical protein